MNIQRPEELQKAMDAKFLACATSAQAATKSDSTEITPPAAVYVGTGGDVAVMTATGNTAVVFKNVPDGTILPVLVAKIMSTDTTGSDFVILR